MMKYLNRLKAKKGFSMVELVIVIAIIGVIMAALLINMIGGNTDKILAANSNAEVFFPACQLAFTRAQHTECSLVEYADTDTKYIEYKEGINQIPDGKYLFLEASFSQNGIEGVHIAFTLNELMASTNTFSRSMTALESYFAQNLDKYLSDSYDGFFYAAVDNDFKVLFTHFCDSRFPSCSGDLTSFRDDLMIADGKIKGNSRIVGSCSDVYTVPATGDYAFNIPVSSDTNYSLYLS